MPVNYRESLKNLAARGLRWSGALRLMDAFSRHFEIASSSAGKSAMLRRNNTAKFAIVCYHRVGSGGAPFYSNFDPATFEAQIRFLRNAYRIISMDELCSELNEPGRATQAIALTFDDGYKDLYAHAFPILRRYGIPATIYLTAAAIETGELSWYDRIFAQIMRYPGDTLQLDGKVSRQIALPSRATRIHAAAEIVRTLRGYTNQHRIEACAELEKCVNLPEREVEHSMLTWEQIREMQAHGILFGAHTMNHPAVRALSAAERDRELMDSKSLLEERLQRPVDHFAYPFGLVSDIDAETCSALPQYGYRSAVSMVWGLNTAATHRYLLRRVGGEEPNLSVFAARLRWLFLKAQQDTAAVRGLELAVNEIDAHGGPLGKNAWINQDNLRAEVNRA